MAKINLNQFPYFDDYNEKDKYYQILFKPGKAVQARELTQLQTILQKQIERLGSHLFKDGSQVIPATTTGVVYSAGNGFLKLSADQAILTHTNQAIETNWIGKTIQNQVGVQAKVIGYRPKDGLDEVRLFVQYTRAATNGSTLVFYPEDDITILDTNPSIVARIPTATQLNGITLKKTGSISSITLAEGVYFFNGYFVYVEKQQIFITPSVDPDKVENQNAWDNKPTALIGLNMKQSFKTSEDDDNLLDVAQGTPNYSAPGADRLYIEAVLEQRLLQTGETRKDENFVNLASISNGEVTYLVLTSSYGPVLDTLARRTYDQSGDYTVTPFVVHMKEFLRNDTNNGVHEETEFYRYTTQEATVLAQKLFGLVGDNLPTGTTPYCTHPTLTNPTVYLPGTSYSGAEDTSFKNLCNSYVSARIDPGKAYVKGYEIQKLSRTTVDIPKARTVSYKPNQTVFTRLGTHFLVKDVRGAPDLSIHQTLELYARPYNKNNDANSITLNDKIGTAKLLRIEFYEGVVGSDNSGTYKLYLYDINMIGNNQTEHVKAIYSPSPNANFGPFYANTFTVEKPWTGTVSRVPATGNAAAYTLYGSGTKWKNDTTQKLSKNDVIKVGSLTYIVAEEPATDNILKVRANPYANSPAPDADNDPGNPQATNSQLQSAWANGSAFSYLYSLPESDSNNAGLLFNLPDPYVATIREGGSNPDTSPFSKTTPSVSYTAPKHFSNKQPISGVITLSSNSIATTESFAIFSNYYAVINETTKTWLRVVNGSSTPSTAGTAAISQTNKEVKITLNDAPNSTYTIIAPVTNSAAKERKKVLQKGTFDSSGNYIKSFYVRPDGTKTVSSNSGGGVVVVNPTASAEISLGMADVFQITRIVMSLTAGLEPSGNKTLNPTTEVDITALYTFDSGQRDYYYDFGKVTLKPTATKPTGIVRVEFDYFNHSIDGGQYFSVDSYPIRNGTQILNYADIPAYVASDGSKYKLTDCIDFRRKIDDTVADIALDNFTCSYYKYLGRHDKLILNSKNSQFELSQGTPAENPLPANSNPDGMTICELLLEPYTADSQAIILAPIENRRYTMRDIEKLETRIKKLEYYTSLTLLEVETAKLTITDANGNNRFKNGFLADNFSGYAVCDLSAVDFNSALSISEGCARAVIYKDSIGLYEAALDAGTSETARTTARTSNRYQKTGDIFTLPYNEVIGLRQGLASRVMNINPFAAPSYIGDIKLTPWSDEWRELNVLPDIRNIDDSQYQATLAAYGLTAPGTSVQYDQDMETWYGPVTGSTAFKKTGKKILKVAGHAVMAKLFPGLPKSKWPKTVKVPPPYANAGAEVPVGFISASADEMESTTTQDVKDIQHGIQTTVNDAGLSPENRALTLSRTTSIEWIRTREVRFEGNCFRPFARMYAFFDDINVSQYCRPAQDADLIPYKFKLTLVSPGQYTATLDASSPTAILSGTNTDGTAWSIKAGAELEFEDRRMDVVSVTNSTTFVVKTKEWSINKTDPTVNTLYTGTLTKYSYGDPLQTNSSGTIKGVFKIPCTDSIKFKTGDATFRLTTSSQNVKPPNPIPQNTSLGDAKYHATGWLDTEQYTVTQTRLVTTTPQLVTHEYPRDPRTNTIKGEGPTYRWDPIAQTFLVKDDGGCFITSVDVFFYNKPDVASANGKLPVRLQLRCVQNGMPTETLPAGDLSTIVKQWDDIILNVPNLATGKLTVTGNVGGENITDPQNPSHVTGYRWTKDTTVKSENQESGTTNSPIVSGVPFVSTDMALDMVPTRFTFASPIYLEENKDYAIVLLSDSNEYEVFVAQTGKNDEAPPRFVDVTGQPNKKIGTQINIGTSVYTDGNFYKSHNGSGWAIDNTMTLKFAVRKAEFSNDLTGEINFYNEQVADRNLLADGIQVYQNDARFRVVLPNHGLSLGDKIKISNITTPVDNATSTTPTIKGILKSVFDNLVVISTEVDHILVTNAERKTSVGYVATSSGRIGGSSATISDNKRFEAITVLTSPFIPAGTSVEWKLVTTSSNGLNNTEFTPTKQPYINIDINQQLEFESSMRVNCPSNETVSQNMMDQKSLIVTAVLRSTNKNISPLIDQSRFTAALVANRLDNPCGLPGVTTQNLNDVFDNLSIITTADSAGGKVFFSTSTGALEGTFTSGSVSTTIITRDTGNSTTQDIRTVLNVGDFVIDESSQQMARVAELLSSNSFRTDVAFNPPLTSATIHGNPQDVYIKTADKNLADKLSQLDIGKYVILSGATSDRINATITRNMPENAGALIKGVEYTPNATEIDPDLAAYGINSPCACKITFGYRTTLPKGLETNNFALIQKDRYIDEIAPEYGSATCKYICKKLVVDRVSNALRIGFDASRDETCGIDLYYRTEKPNSPKSIKEELWIKAPYNVDVRGVLTEKTPQPDDSPVSYSAYESTINDLVGFTAVQVKIVMRGGNAAKPPKIKNFRLIVLDE